MPPFDFFTADRIALKASEGCLRESEAIAGLNEASMSLRTLDKSLTSKSGHLDGIEDRISQDTGSVKPYVNVAKSFASSGAGLIQQHITTFEATSNVLMNALDQLSTVHPFVRVAVLAFKAAVTLEIKRENNDKKIVALHLQMNDMMSALLILRNIAAADEASSDEPTIGQRMTEHMERIAADIKDCANVCDSFSKKKLVVRVLKSVVWEQRLDEYANIFTDHKKEIQFNLSAHTGLGVNAANAKLVTVEATMQSADEKMNMLMLFEFIRSPKEKELMDFIAAKGGAENCMKDDAIVKELVVMGERKPSVMENKTNEAKQNKINEANQAKLLMAVREDLKADLADVLEQNMDIFDKKFRLQVTQIEEVVHRETDRVVGAVTSGPHDKVVDQGIHEVWQEMRWKGSVKARHFVLSLRDYYIEHLHHPSHEVPNSTMPADVTNSSMSPASGPSHSTALRGQISKADEWTLRYINILRIQPLMEAFDDDASGFISVFEANEFTKSRPPGWSVPQWIAYWAAGFHISLLLYRDRITETLQNMYKAVDSVLFGNRVIVDQYLSSLAVIKIERLLAGIRKGVDGFHWNDFGDEELTERTKARNEYEEARLTTALQSIDFHIDAANTLTLIAGTGRVEMSLPMLVFLLLERHYQIIKVAQHIVMSRQELDFAADSLQTIWDAVDDRLSGLKAVFRQQNLDIEGQLKRFCHGLFLYWEKDLGSLSKDYYNSGEGFEPLIFSRDVSEDQAQIEGSDGAKLLHFGADTDDWDLGGYAELESEEPAIGDALSLNGTWHGYYHYLIDTTTTDGVMRFTIQESSEDGKLQGSGTDALGSFSIEGRSYLHSPGITRVNMKKAYQSLEDEDGHPQVWWYEGILNEDSRNSIYGLCGPDNEDATDFIGIHLTEATAGGSFQIQRRSIEFFLFRPSEQSYKDNKARALWSFAMTAILHAIRVKLFSWKLLAERRLQRQRFVELHIRKVAMTTVLRNDMDHDSLTEDETKELQSLEETLHPRDVRLYRSIAVRHMRRTTGHGVYCDSCSKPVQGTRYVCLVCAQDEVFHTVDLCGNCTGGAVDRVAASGGITRKVSHSPQHGLLQLRMYLHYRRSVQIRQVALETLGQGQRLFDGMQVSHLDALMTVKEEAFVTANAGIQPSCAVCRAGVQRPVWKCVTCDEHVFICIKCNKKYEKHKPWLYEPAEGWVDTAKRGHHWSHPLALCQEDAPSSLPAEPDETKLVSEKLQARMTDLETRFAAHETSMNEWRTRFGANVEGRMDRLEDLLMQLLNRAS